LPWLEINNNLLSSNPESREGKEPTSEKPVKKERNFLIADSHKSLSWQKSSVDENQVCCIPMKEYSTPATDQ